MDKHKDNYLKVILGLLSMTLMIYIGSTLFKKARVDITEEGLYTLSKGTKSILSKLDSPIKLKTVILGFNEPNGSCKMICASRRNLS